jgi:hypothetical protein
MLKLAGIGTLLLAGAGVTAIVIRARSAALPPRYLTSPLERGALSATVTATGTSTRPARSSSPPEPT